MATILFNDAVANPDLLADFDPTVDILLFTENAASTVGVTSESGSVTLSTADGSVTLDIDVKAITSGTAGFIRFIDGGGLFIGDGTEATVADDLANNISDLATDGGDHFRGLGGNDSVDAGKGDDLIYGNAGNDSIVSFSAGADGGHDTIFAGQGDDKLDYANSSDAILAYGNLGDDFMFGSNVAADTMYGGQGEDTLRGGLGDDVLYGNADDDEINGGDGSNLLFGGQGNDSLYAGDDSASTTYGNLGDDIIYASTNGHDTIFGGQGDDVIYGNGDDNHVFGNAGNDDYTSNGDDSFTGGEGADTLRNSGYSNAFLDFNGTEDVVMIYDSSARDIAINAYGGAIIDSDTRGFLFKGANILIDDDGETLTLVGAAGQTLTKDNLVLSDGSVFVYNVGGAAGSFEGGTGHDFMIAGDNGDTMTAGTGDDTLIGGDGNDVFVMGANLGSDDQLMGGEGDDSVTATVDDATNIDVTYDSVEQITLSWGSGTGDAVVGFNQDAPLSVDASSFTVGQNATLYFDTGSSVAGATVVTGTGDDSLWGTTAAGDTITAGDGADTIYGYGGDDVLNGGAGEDFIYGMADADTLTGGGGADLFHYSSGTESGFTLTTVDHITDFKGGEDKIEFSGGGAVVFDQRLVDLSSAADLGAATQAAYDASTGVAASDAVLFVFGGHTYVFVNDGDGGYSTDFDLLIDITGFTGTITDADFI